MLPIDDALEYRIAKSKVDAYRNDPVLQDLYNAQGFADCEQWLEKGINAFSWLERLEETIKAAAAEGVFECTPDVNEALDSLYEAWLVPCQPTERWIAALNERGYRPENLDKFQECRELVDEHIQRAKFQEATRRTRARAFSEEEW